MDFVDGLVDRCEAIFIDTQLLVLLIVGTMNPDLIPKFKRTRSYDSDDLMTLLTILERARRRCVTSNVVTETDNLVRQLPAHEHERAAATLKEFLTHWIEVHNPSGEFAGGAEHAKFGMTDAILIHISNNALVLTDDFRLAGKIASTSGNVINFNHLKPVG